MHLERRLLHYRKLFAICVRNFKKSKHITPNQPNNSHNYLKLNNYIFWHDARNTKVNQSRQRIYQAVYSAQIESVVAIGASND